MGKELRLGEELGIGVIMGVEGAAGGVLLAATVMKGKAFQPKGETTVFTRRVTGEGGGGQFMGA